MDEGSSVRANEQEAGRCLFRAHGGDIGMGVSLLAGKGALIPGWLRNRVDGKWSTIDKALSSPWSPMCPHWCHCLGSSSLSYPTGLTKPKRDWSYYSSFLFSDQRIDPVGSRSGGLVFILLQIITPLAFSLRFGWVDLLLTVISLSAKTAQSWYRT